jgi:predicted alpha/beta superfamily hydrolase
MFRTVFATLLVIHGTIGLPNSALAQQTPAEVTLPGTELHEFRTESGILYNIYVALPLGYEPGARDEYPVLYVTDASQAFAALVQMYGLMALSGELPPMILLGIDKPTSSVEEWVAVRHLDLTPTSVPEYDRAVSAQSGLEVRSGGAEAFLAVLREEIIPWTEARYSTAPERGLVGYSLGGLFATHALFSSSGLFTHYLIGSPSIWWDDELMFEREEVYAAEFDDLNARVFMYGGTLEGTQLRDMLRMAEALKARGYEGLELDSYIGDGETHNSGAFIAINRGLRALFGAR